MSVPLLIEIDGHFVRHGEALAGQHVALFDLVIFKRVVGDHVDLAFQHLQRQVEQTPALQA